MGHVRLSANTYLNMGVVVRVREETINEGGRTFRGVKVRYLDGESEVFEGEEGEAILVYLARNSEPAEPGGLLYAQNETPPASLGVRKAGD
jgi:hypothetical protein